MGLKEQLASRNVLIEPQFIPLATKLETTPEPIRDLMRERHKAQRNELNQVTGALKLAFNRGYDLGVKDTYKDLDISLLKDQIAELEDKLKYSEQLSEDRGKFVSEYIEKSKRAGKVINDLVDKIDGEGPSTLRFESHAEVSGIAFKKGTNDVPRD